MSGNRPRLHIGFIGLGAMGGPMCARLVTSGCDITAFDLLPIAVSAAMKDGAHGADDARQVGQVSDIVFLSLPRSEHVRDAVLGPLGCAGSMHPGSVVIDLSSSRPSSTRVIAADLAARGIEFLDAPVSRGVPNARTGTLSMMVGGVESTFRRCESVLRILASDIFFIGPAGTGHVVKAANNLLSATNLIAALEAVLIGAGLGIDAQTLIESINGDTGRSNATDDRFPRYILPRRFESDFSLGLMYKDIQTAVELALEFDVPLPMTGWTRDLYALAMSAGMAGADNQAITLFVERLFRDVHRAHPRTCAATERAAAPTATTVRL